MSSADNFTAVMGDIRGLPDVTPGQVMDVIRNHEDVTDDQIARFLQDRDGPFNRDSLMVALAHLSLQRQVTVRTGRWRARRPRAH